MNNRRASSSSHRSERWLLSYADLLTLLFACVATLYALELRDQGVDEFAESNRRAFSANNHPKEAQVPGLGSLDQRIVLSALPKNTSHRFRDSRELEIELPARALLDKSGRLSLKGLGSVDKILNAFGRTRPTLSIVSEMSVTRNRRINGKTYDQVSASAHEIARYLVEEWLYDPARITTGAKISRHDQSLGSKEPATAWLVRFVVPMDEQSLREE